ncbi:hypothetical protein LJC18_01105 [Lachnospiraceae bacterium OttesenSCG-928-E19]|nr:hypothetical protein [Lachnospiraceae bacterium OttesenSCG-928-E19]
MKNNNGAQIDVKIGNKKQCLLCKYDIANWQEKCPLLQMDQMPGIEISKPSFVARERKSMEIKYDLKHPKHLKNSFIGALIKFSVAKSNKKFANSLMLITNHIHTNCLETEK